MKFADIGPTILYIIALVVLYFFWGCHLDLYVTILAAVVVIVAVMTTYIQNKQIKKLTPEEKQD